MPKCSNDPRCAVFIWLHSDKSCRWKRITGKRKSHPGVDCYEKTAGPRTPIPTVTSRVTATGTTSESPTLLPTHTATVTTSRSMPFTGSHSSQASTTASCTDTPICFEVMPSCALTGFTLRRLGGLTLDACIDLCTNTPVCLSVVHIAAQLKCQLKSRSRAITAGLPPVELACGSHYRTYVGQRPCGPRSTATLTVPTVVTSPPRPVITTPFSVSVSPQRTPQPVIPAIPDHGPVTLQEPSLSETSVLGASSVDTPGGQEEGAGDRSQSSESETAEGTGIDVTFIALVVGGAVLCLAILMVVCALYVSYQRKRRNRVTSVPAPDRAAGYSEVDPTDRPKPKHSAVEQTLLMDQDRQSSSGTGSMFSLATLSPRIPMAAANRFVVSEVHLGKGSNGAILKGMEVRTGVLVAMKSMLAGTAHEAQELEKELETLQALAHTNIVRYLGQAQSTKHGDLIVIELCAGGSLHHVVKEFGALPSPTVREYTHQMLEGLYFLHHNRIVHRDFKTLNVLLTTAGVCKIADFGNAFLVNARNDDTMACTLGQTMVESDHIAGTPLFMAPEVIRKEVSAAGDVWALALTVVEIATGTPPWPDLSQLDAHSIMAAISCATEYPLPPSLPGDLRSFLTAPLQFNPSLRPKCSALSAHAYVADRPTPQSQATTYIRGHTALGKGSFGVVVKGLDTQRGALVAIKEVRDGVTADLQHEIDMLKRLRHPHVVSYLGTIGDGSTGQQDIVLELCAGGSLDSVIRAFGRLPIETTRLYTGQLVAGLHFLHQNRIVHRDFKTANVLLTDDGHCRISDFGTVKLVPNKTSYGVGGGSAVGPMTEGGQTLASSLEGAEAIVGTPIYMAPEVIKRQVGASGDVWALGLTVLEMATGSPPWPELAKQSPYDVMDHISCVGRYPIPSQSVHPSVDVFVKRCLQPTVQQRATCTELLGDPLLTIAN